MPGTLNNRLILRDKYIRDTTAIALSEGDLKEQLVEARAQLAVTVAALKSAPMPRIDGVCDNYELCDCWDCAYYTWFDLQRQAAMAAVEDTDEY